MCKGRSWSLDVRTLLVEETREETRDEIYLGDDDNKVTAGSLARKVFSMYIYLREPFYAQVFHHCVNHLYLPGFTITPYVLVL